MATLATSSADSVGSVENTAAPQSPALDGDEAARLMTLARRSYAIAELVQERRIIGDVDSAIAAHRALTGLLELVLRLHGDAVPDEFSELSARARAVAREENLLAEDPGDDLALVHEMRGRVVQGSPHVSGAEDRAYDRAFVRSAAWFEGVQSYLDQHFPPQQSRWKKRLQWGLGVAFVFALGVVIGRHVRPDDTPVAEVPLPATNADAERAVAPQAGLAALETPARLLLTDPHVACTGCWPLEGSVAAPFAWTSGRVEMVVRGLLARRRYHVALGIADPGHAGTLRFTASDGTTSSDVPIGNGPATSPTPFTAGDDGVLHFGVQMNPWKPSDHVKGSADTRALGVALSDVRLAEAPEHDPAPVDSAQR